MIENNVTNVLYNCLTHYLWSSLLPIFFPHILFVEWICVKLHFVQTLLHSRPRFS